MKLARRRSKTPCKLSESLDRRLNLYALAAGAGGVSLLSLAQPAKAEVVFTPAHFTLTNGQLPIDLNHDGVVDFVLMDKGVFTTGTSCNFCGQYLNVRGNGSAGAGVVGMQQAAALKVGAVIGPDDTFQSVESASLLMASGFDDSNSFFPIHGNFANVSARFLGLRFEINGETHFGWARFSYVRVGFGRKPFVTAVLNGYAYETTPNQPILARGIGPIEASDSQGPHRPNPEPSLAPAHAALGVLGLGSPGLSIWRRKASADNAVN